MILLHPCLEVLLNATAPATAAAELPHSLITCVLNDSLRISINSSLDYTIGTVV
jgi:hypothetical protein